MMPINRLRPCYFYVKLFERKLNLAGIFLLSDGRHVTSQLFPIFSVFIFTHHPSPITHHPTYHGIAKAQDE
jgi:hypothetical protein